MRCVKVCACVGIMAALFVVGNESVWGAAATWSEEMDALPNQGTAGQVWAGWDDAGGGNGQIWSDPGSPLEYLPNGPDGATGVWRIPPGAFPIQDSGMAVADEGATPAVDDNAPRSPLDGLTQYTWEARYRVVTTMGEPLNAPGTMEAIRFPSQLTGDFNVYPVYFDLGTSGPSKNVRVNGTGYISSRGVANASVDGYSYGQIHINEGIAGSQGLNLIKTPAQFGPHAFDTWHTLRVTQDFDPTDARPHVIKAYLNGVEYFNIETSGLAVCCNRSVTIRRGSGDGSTTSTAQGAVPDEKWTIADYMGMEAMFDYVRIVDRVIPITEALNAPGGCAGNLNGDSTTDGADVAIIYNAWGTNNAVADIDNSGTVDGADLAQVFNCWGQADTAGVPEPTSLGVLGIGLLGLLAVRRKV